MEKIQYHPIVSKKEGGKFNFENKNILYLCPVCYQKIQGSTQSDLYKKLLHNYKLIHPRITLKS